MGFKRRPDLNGDWPFPFFGAGDASYFEWAEVHVRFAREPSEPERKAIAKGVPYPLRDSIDFSGRGGEPPAKSGNNDFSGTHLMVASGQFAHVAIADTYKGGADAVHPSDPEAWASERFFFAGGSQVTEFNQHIEAWLLESHQRCPIACVYRAEDGESGGTQLTEWHNWSLEQASAMWSLFEAAASDDHPEHHMLVGVAHMVRAAGREVPESLIDRLMPGHLELEAVDRGDLDGLRRQLARHGAVRDEVIEVLSRKLKPDKEAHRIALVGIAEILLAAPGLPSKCIGALARAAALANNGGLLDQVMARASAELGVAEAIASAGYSMLKAGECAPAIPLFDALIARDDLSKGTYTNALYAVLADNSGIPHDRERTLRFIERCAPRAPENPSIWLNLVCALAELGDTNDAVETIRRALATGQVGLEVFENEELLAPLRETETYRALRSG